MKKTIKILSVLMIVCLMVFVMVACDNENPQGTDDPPSNNPVHVDYVAGLKLDMNSNTLKQVVTIENHVDGDTVHFEVPTTVVANGILKGRFLAVNTPESTGKIEPYGHSASRFTKNALKNAASILIESDDDKWNVDSTGDRYMVWVWYKPTANSEYRNLNVELLQNGLAVASNTANNRYGETAFAALNQARVEKLLCHSGIADPEIYTGEAIVLSIKELRADIESYKNKKVAVEGVVAKNSSQTAYVEYYDEDTDMYYGISVYYGYGLSGTGMSILNVGNEVRIVGVVQFYETGGTWQISDVQYRDMKPDDPNNLRLINEGSSPAFATVDANTFVNGKVTINSNEYDFAELMLSASIKMENLTITSIYTTNNGGSSDGAMTFTCRASDGTVVDVRTVKIYDESGRLLTEADYEGKTITVTGIVDYFNGDYQIKVFSQNDITIVE